MTTPARHLLAAAHALDQHRAEALRPHGLSPSQFDALTAYADPGRAGTTCSNVARALGLSVQSVSHTTHALRARGLIKPPGPHVPGSGRSMPLAATADGRQLLARARKAVWPVEAHAAELLGESGEQAVAAAAEALKRPPSHQPRPAGHDAAAKVQAEP